jgi:V/A-type H+-transporting ATPase subunit E
MTDQVQHLIDRIRRDAVESAQTDATRIQQEARDEARRTVEQAQTRAAALVAEAEQKARALVDRGGKALEQAARDLLIAIGQRLQSMIDALLVDATQQALRPEVVEQMLLQLCEGLAKSGLDEKAVTVAIGPGERDRITGFAVGKLREALQKGAQVHIDQHLQHGFRLSFGNDTVRHDFTPAAIAALLAQFVRPQLGEIIQRAALGVSAGKP